MLSLVLLRIAILTPGRLLAYLSISNSNFRISLLKSTMFDGSGSLRF